MGVHFNFCPLVHLLSLQECQESPQRSNVLSNFNQSRVYIIFPSTYFPFSVKFFVCREEKQISLSMMTQKFLLCLFSPWKLLWKIN